ncbi:hypothetical protein [Estrella lausannensis]|uniref:Putative secreted protein n=1 Tax=Estrella lausannensis TaxID=483423 RepID=A0A0H5DPA2_9BACT|nr:hypothetical protein [Estrella lausannensis]CRX38351.1 putative secreted protein [Estrella lausannensis]
MKKSFFCQALPFLIFCCSLAHPAFTQTEQLKQELTVTSNQVVSKQLFKVLLLIEMQHPSTNDTEFDNHILETEVRQTLSVCQALLPSADEPAQKALCKVIESVNNLLSPELLNHDWDLLASSIWRCIQSLREEASSHQYFEKGILYNDLGDNPHISHPEELAIRRHLLPYESAARKTLDAIFFTSRAVESPDAFIQAGFTPLLPILKNKIVIASHIALPDMIIKTYLDCYPVNKSGTADWVWLSRRCALANKIRKCISKNHYKHFTVPHKWLYPIANTTSQRVHALLIEEKMDLVSSAENKEAWLTIPKEALRELLEIMLSEGGQSYRPDNIWKTKGGKFAFIDTEYPHLPPRFLEFSAYLDRETQQYWKMLVIQRLLSETL